ncbi:MAG: FHA domain-containing protein [Roseiflexus sp.]
MDAIEFEVYWSSSESKTVTRDSDQTIGEVVQSLIKQLHLDEYDSQKQRIIYGLFREKEGERERMQDSRTLKQARLQGQKVYIANVAAPWWQTTPPPTQQPKKETAPLRRRPAEPVVSPSYACRLQIAPNCTVVVQENYLEIDRNYLSSKLPSAVLLKEKASLFSGYDSRLMHVSRTQHCAIFRQGNGWFLRATKPTYVEGKLLNSGQTVAIRPPQMQIILGKEGWPITIELFES